MNQAGLLIASIEASVARRTGLRAGDRILRVNGKTVQDELEYRFHTAGDRASLEVRRSCEEKCFRVSLTERESRGLLFPPMRIRRCRNRCVFCFVDQLPDGLRKTLYIKDEDCRFSFLFGNYVTLASATDEELERIRRMRMSPLYISVHATDPDIRNFLLGRKKSRDILAIVESMTRWGITLHAQVVLCPGINDGNALERTISDLARFRPGLASIAVVPVGLTRFRKEKRLTPLKGVSRNDALKIIRQSNELKLICKEDPHGGFLYLADEFYWKARLPFPSIQEYGDLPQLENGVGMIPLFVRQWEESRNRERRGVPGAAGAGPFTIVTGELAYPHLLPYVRWLGKVMGLRVNLVPVRNRLLGRQVTVAGLITGQDIMRQLADMLPGKGMLLVPDVMLDHDGVRFLDDVSLKDLERVLRIPVASFPPDPENFEKILEKQASPGVRKRKTDPMVD
jgi:putative radical SAM enzyme (TIGR03279 family)